MEFGEISDFTYLKFFENKVHSLQISLIKSLIYTIKQYKNFKNFLTTIDIFIIF